MHVAEPNDANAGGKDALHTHSVVATAGACLDRGAAIRRQRARCDTHHDSMYVHARTCHVHVTLHIMSVCLYDCSLSVDCCTV